MRWLWHAAILVLFVVMGSGEAMAGKADVVDVKVTREKAGTYRFDVTVSSDDTGWDKYADRWEVLGPGGAVLGTRVLVHPHETEQPFTRSQSGIMIPEDVKTVTIRAHDKVEGYGGKEMSVEVPLPAGG